MHHRSSIALNKRIIFALDVSEPALAREWVTRLEPSLGFFKVGLELFLAGGFPIVDWITNRGHEVMLDLKFFDVPQTVRAAVQQLRSTGISLATVHGNDAILQAAVEGAEGFGILAVTALTSLDESDLKELGFACSPESLVLSRAKRALELGCAGVVSSGMEIPGLRAAFGSSLLLVAPGVRPVENRTDDQKRIVTVHEAFVNGADHVVLGRPIRQAEDPLRLIGSLQQQIEEALSQR